MDNIVKQQKRDNKILTDKLSKIESIYSAYEAYLTELAKYIDKDDDEYAKQVARYSDIRQLVRESIGLKISIMNLKQSLQYAIHEDGNDKIKDLHEKIEEKWPSMNLASVSDDENTDYNKVGDDDRVQWP